MGGSRCALLLAQIPLQTFAAQLACGAVAATVARDAVVASQCLVADDVEHAEAVGQGPGGTFVNPHQGCVDDKLLVHREVERYVEALDKRVAAVGIARVVRLRYARDDMANAVLAGIDGSDTQEEEVAARHEGVGRRVGGFLLVHLDGRVRQRVAAQLPDEGRGEFVEMHARLGGQLFGHLRFQYVLLPIVKAEGEDFLKVSLGPVEAGRGVLTAAENHQCLVGKNAHRVHTFYSFLSVENIL